MILSLRIDEAVRQLRRAFPVAAPKMTDFRIEQPSEYPDEEGQSYASIQASCIEPIVASYDLILKCGAAISNHFGAHG